MPPRFSREIELPMVSTTQVDYQPRTSPCENACPAGNPIQKMHDLIRENRFEEALEYLRARNPFPATTGRICTRPCENDCNRLYYDEAINIRGLERTASDFADWTKVRRPAKMESSGKKIAVIGGGPAGLSFAYFSSLFGHKVTIFEAGPILGGMPRLTIPDYRLPKNYVDMEIGMVLETGVKALTNTRVGRDISVLELRNSFDAVLIATGTWNERKLEFPGADKAMNGVEFLRQVNLGQIRTAGKKTIIIGGGGVAFDCAFTAKRLGAEEVHVVCLEKADSMRAPLDDLVQAEQEGVVIHNSCMISELLEKDGNTAGIRFFDVAGFCFDAKGEAEITATTDKMQTLAAEMVVVAAGLKPELDFLDDSGILLNPDGTIQVNPGTKLTAVDGIFAAGDVVCGPSIVARAVGQGRESAIAVNRFLTGINVNKLIVLEEDNRLRVMNVSDSNSAHVVCFDEMLNSGYYEKNPRLKSVISPRLSFSERNEGLPESGITREAARCFHCGHCSKCGTCVEDCPGLILAMGDKGPQVAYPEECWHCGNCRISCPNSAISFEFPLTMLV
jgi:formate dehydrogenase (NADP+) beta subunit